MRWLPLCLVVACTAPAVDVDDPPMDAGTTPDPNDAGGTDAGETPDPDAGFMPITLGSCTAPSPLPADPLSRTQAVDVRRHPLHGRLVHMIDVEKDARGVVYGAGVGGLFTFTENNGTYDLAGVYAAIRDFFKIALMDNNRVALTNRDRGLFIVDATNPANLVEAQRVQIADASGMAFASPHLYVLTHTGELVVRTAQAEVNRLSGFGNPWEIEIVGTRAYVADNTLGVVVVDLSTPTAPSIVTTVATAGGAQDLSIGNDVLFVAVGGAGVEAFDLANPDAPVSLGTIAYGSSVVSVSVSGSTLWATNHEDVLALDVSDPANPLPLAAELTSQWAMHVFAEGNRAFVANWEVMEVYDLGSALAPEADVSRSELYFTEGSASVTFDVANRGGANLQIAGGDVDDARFALSASALEVEPGEAATITVEFSDDGQPVDAELCIATNDPDEPLTSVSLQSSNTNTSIAIGQQAIDFVLPDLDGNNHQLSAQLGNPVVLVYFATW